MKMEVLIASLLLAASVRAVEWKNVDPDHYRGGRKASNGYLQGKVVLVDRWGVGCPPCRALLPRLEELWTSFKTKDFVLLGGHCEGWGSSEGIRKLIAANRLSYPMYEGAGLASGEPTFDAIPFLYVVDETGCVIYHGHSERDATQAVVMALTDMASPRSVIQWQRFLDYELEHLPAHAFLRLDAFRKKYPEEAKAYTAKARVLVALPDIRKVAELVEFARTNKDHAPTLPAERSKLAQSLRQALRKYASLKDSPDPRLAQEAKNAIADLKWTIASL